MKKRILVVDDLAGNRRILNKMLSADYEIIEAANGFEAENTIQSQGHQISAVLLDISMPGMDGYEVLRRIRENAALSDIPVIMITGSEDESARVKALALGANDFVMKPYSSEIIKHCLRNTISLYESASIISNLQLDKLTKLLNRDAFLKRAEEMIRSKAPGYYAMGFFDVDKFKVINDQYGMEKGDELLKHIATSFKNGFEPYGGICCRITADNFVVLYPASMMGTPELEEIRRSASSFEGIVAPIVFSIGRYIVDDTSVAPGTMLDRAVMAAETINGRYDTKIAVYNESMRAHLLHEQAIVMEMEGALRKRQFEVWYQPQVNHSTGAQIGAEALVRWRHPDRGLISPDLFIPVFEKNGFIYELDQYVWEEVCSCLHRWSAEGREPLPVSVNISRDDVFHPDIVATISGLTEKYNLPVELLRLEITETAFANSGQQVTDVVKLLIERGFTVEIDDFGSGYSSLNTLKDVPAQIIKLDMRFFESGNSERGGNIIESVVRMAKWLGMSVIAEGVETSEQADFLRSIGCSYIQGYLYARPMPVADYEAYCADAKKEGRLLTLETVENLDNNSFWDPKSMDTLIFNSYIGGACIYEYRCGKIELLRATEKYAQVIGSAGMTVEDALKLNWTEHLDAETFARVIADLEKSIATKNEVTGEYVFFDLPGCPHETYLRSSMRVIAATGDRYLVYCTNENITAQRESENRERESTQQVLALSERFQAIMNNVDLGIIAAVVKENSAQYVFANERYYSMLGYTKEQLENEVYSPYQTVAPEDLQMVTEQTSQLTQIGDSALLEYRALMRDGQRRFIRAAISVSSLSGIDSPVQLSVVRDITEEKELERSKRWAAEQLQSMMDDMPGGYARLQVFPDGSVRPVYINEGYCRIVGLDSEEVMRIHGEDSLAGVHPDDVPAAQKAVAHMLETHEPMAMRYRLKRNGGEYMWVNIFCRITEDAQGVYLNSYYTDATEQVKKDETQRELLDNLPYGVGLYEYIDGKLSVKYLNKRYWQLVHRNETTYPNGDCLDAVHPDDRAIIAREIATTFREKRNVACDIRVRYGESEYCALHVAARSLESRNGAYTLYAVYNPISDEMMSIQEMLPIALSAVMNAQTEYTFVKDKSLRYICCSKQIAHLAGCTSEKDLIGKKDVDFLDKALADAFEAEDLCILETGEPIIDSILRIPSENGADRYACTSKFPLKDAHGNIVGLYGTGRDVTESRNMKSRFELLTDSIPGGIATYEYRDGTIRITYFNDGFCKLFDTTKEKYQAIGSQNILKGIYAEDLPALRAQLDSLIRDNTQADCLYRVHLPNGGYKWINLKATCSERTEEKIVFNAVLLDVTQRQEAIELARISEEENRLAVELGGNVMARYRISDRTLTVTSHTAAVYSLPEVISNVPEEPVRLGMIAPESVDAYIGFFASIFNGSKVATATFQQKYLGKWRWMEANSSTVFSDDDKPVKAVISFRDVTDQIEKETIYKKWQQSMQDRNPETYTLFRYNLNTNTIIARNVGSLMTFDFDAAGDMVRERTTAYVNQCIYEEDRDMMAAFLNADTMLAEYYRGHRTDAIDYRELLPDGGYRWLRLTVDLVEYPNSTDVEAYLMSEDIDEAKKTELSAKKLAQTDPLTGVLNRTTFIARTEKFIRDSHPNTRHALLMLDLDGFKLVNDTFGHGAGDRALIDIAKGIHSILRRDDLVARLGGDEFLVFLNDIQDDHSATLKAQQICAISRKAFSLEVQISGSVGIALAPRDGIDFDTLYKKADSALYYVKGSGKDNYAFYSDSMEDQHLKPEADEVTADGTKKKPKKRRMLIVDDNTIEHALLQNIFKDEFIIEKAKDGNTALIRLRHYGSAISVVLLDLMMPGMDGFAVLEKMQQSSDLKSIPVLIVSGDETREAAIRAVRSGAADFIPKPVDPSILRVRVQSAISKAENEKLRARNSLLELQNEERIRFSAAIDSTRIAFVEYDWLKGTFGYYPSISKYLCGRYDSRTLWEILLSDGAADAKTVQAMQEFTNRIAESGNRTDDSMITSLKTPNRQLHRFRMNVRKLMDAYGQTNKLIITFCDLDAEDAQAE